MRFSQMISCTRKIMAAAVFAGLLFAMHESAMADMITIGHASNGAVYRAYKIFNLTCQADKSSYAYTMEASNPFFAAVQAFAGAESNGLTLQQIGASTTYNVYFDPAVFTGAAADSSPLRAAGKAGELAAVLRKAANTLSPGELAACMAGSVTAVSDEQDGLVIDVGTDNHGYYFVTTTSGSVFSLDSAAPDITVYDKNVRPTIDKCVEEGGVYGDTNDGEIGSNANFRTYIYAGAGARGYVLHDVMDDGLRWNRDVKVYAEDPAYTGGDRISAADVIFRPVPEGSETWQVTGGAAADTAETFTIVFADAWLDSNVTEDRVLLVTYSAVITEAAVPAAAQINKTWLQYGENSKTAEDITRTYTWEVNIYKYTGGSQASPLAGAVFKILNADKRKAAIVTDGKLSGWEDLAGGDAPDDGKITAGSELITPSSGKLRCAGLDAGTYYLAEVAAPAGYNRLNAPVMITIRSSENGSGAAAVRTAAVAAAAVIASQPGGDGEILNPGDDGYDAATYIQVENKQGSLLPSTGGPGTGMLYGLGVMLLLGAGILLLRRRL